MKIIRAKDYADMSRKAANIISALVDWYNKGDIDFSEVTTVNLDEYRGLPKEHPESYWSFMHRNLFDKVNIDPPRSTCRTAPTPMPRMPAQSYNRSSTAVGGIDLQLLGIGHDGHIGFNEPGEAFELETHCVDPDPRDH